MAERRMFARSIMLFGKYPDLSKGAKVLYVHLNLLADDDGFVGNVRPQIRNAGCTKKHLQELVEQGLVLLFPDGPVAIAHWHIHNKIRKDRYKPTILREEIAQLTQTENGTYRFLLPEERLSVGCQSAAQPATQGRIGEEREEKVSEEEVRKGKKKSGALPVPPESSSSSSYTPFEKLVLETYNKNCQGLAECLYLDEDIRRKIKGLEDKGWEAEFLDKAFRVAGECAFLQGENDRGWKGTLEWLCDDDNLRKVCAGKYKTYKKPSQVPHGCGELGEAELEAIRRLLEED